MHAIEDATARVEVNSRFHSMIAQFSGNDRVVDYLADFRERVNRDMYLSSSMQCVHTIVTMNMITS